MRFLPNEMLRCVDCGETFGAMVAEHQHHGRSMYFALEDGIPVPYCSDCLPELVDEREKRYRAERKADASDRRSERLFEALIDAQSDTPDNPYIAGWSAARRERLEQDEFECVDCGLSNDTHIKRHGHSLHVHHLRPARTFDDPADAHELSNLVTLCTDCHVDWEALALKRQELLLGRN